MKKLLSVLLCACLLLTLLTITACGSGKTTDSKSAGTESTQSSQSDVSQQLESKGSQPDTSQQPETENNQPDTSQQPETEPEQPSGGDGAPSNSNILVAYFSLAGEQYEVGVIEKGNTEIVAEMIAGATGADTFKIESTTEYPTTYDGLLDISQKEKENPPKIANTVENMDEYDTIFLGYPIWWGGTPTIIKVFLQSYDFSGKTIIPFCTHGGSGLAGTAETIRELCPDSTIGEGLAIRGKTAQEDPDSAQESVAKWLSDNRYVNPNT